MLNFSLKHWKTIHAWWGSPLGQSFLKTEALEINKVAPRLFGYHLLLLGESQLMQCVAESPITHRVWIHPDTSSDIQNDGNPLTARFDKLPILSDSVDVVYLGHCLEFVNNPHEVLRETFRVLIPEGYAIISGFNPWSIWGFYRWIMHYIKRLEWDGQFISITKLKDWVALLGFDVVRVRRYFYRPPISKMSWLQRLKWLETLGEWCWPFLGGGYVVVAKKRVLTLTAIKPAWQERRKIIPSRVAEPAARVE